MTVYTPSSTQDYTHAGFCHHTLLPQKRCHKLAGGLLQILEAVAGAFCDLPSPTSVEILGYLGFDFAIVDAEHGISDYETCEHMIRAAEVSGITPITRVGLNLQQHILRYLDAGTMGVQIPLVNTREEAQGVMYSAKYPPTGGRGLAGVRAANYGLTMSLGEYVKMANEEVMVVVQIETMRAVENLKEILAVDGIDVVFLGPTDLSSSMGLPGQTTSSQVVELIERCGREIVAAGKAAGTIARDPQAFKEWKARGFQYLCTGVSSFMAQAARTYIQGIRG